MLAYWTPAATSIPPITLRTYTATSEAKIERAGSGSFSPDSELELLHYWVILASSGRYYQPCHPQESHRAQQNICKVVNISQYCYLYTDWSKWVSISPYERPVETAISS
jgi:hypothetical protein